MIDFYLLNGNHYEPLILLYYIFSDFEGSWGGGVLIFLTPGVVYIGGKTRASSRISLA